MSSEFDEQSDVADLSRNFHTFITSTLPLEILANTLLE